MPTIVIATLACMAGAFLICGIPSGLIIARHSSEHVDVRKVGSGNIGMTNVARSAGGGAAALTLLCDAGKGYLAIMLGRLIVSQVAFGGDFSQTAALGASGWSTTALYMACVLGHVYSPYLGFHGGKGISVGLGGACRADALRVARLRERGHIASHHLVCVGHPRRRDRAASGGGRRRGVCA